MSGREQEGVQVPTSSAGGAATVTSGLSKPNARMDTYQVGHEVFSFIAMSIDEPLRARKLKEQHWLTVFLATIQRLEEDSCVMTMIGSFLNCSCATSNHLLEEAMLEEGMLEGTCRLG